MTVATEPAPAGARVLLYGLQSCGASLMAFLASQGPRTLGVIDLWNAERAPDLEHGGPIVLKATTGPVDIETQVEAFRPTSTVLVLRNPVDQIASLGGKSYRDYALPMETKLAEFDRVFSWCRSRFTRVLTYEALVSAPAETTAALEGLGLELPADAERLPRSLEEVVEYARETSPWCRANWRTKWGVGRVHTGRVGPAAPAAPEAAPEALELARRHCPQLLDHYG
jgi:hypothetical protein